MDHPEQAQPVEARHKVASRRSSRARDEAVLTSPTAWFEAALGAALALLGYGTGAWLVTVLSVWLVGCGIKRSTFRADVEEGTLRHQVLWRQTRMDAADVTAVRSTRGRDGALRLISAGTEVRVPLLSITPAFARWTLSRVPTAAFADGTRSWLENLAAVSPPLSGSENAPPSRSDRRTSPQPASSGGGSH